MKLYPGHGASARASKMLIIDASKCVGCRVCELVCSARHHRVFAPSRASIGIVKFDEASRDIPSVCCQCEKAVCAAVCRSGAIRFDPEKNAYFVDSLLCIGCKLCVSACPFGNLRFDDVERRVVKCDLCGGTPECVELCPSGAISFGESSLATAKKRRQALGEYPRMLESLGLKP